jgi:hypothetical protein
VGGLAYGAKHCPKQGRLVMASKQLSALTVHTLRAPDSIRARASAPIGPARQNVCSPFPSAHVSGQSYSS